MGIAISYLSSAAHEKVDDIESGGFADILNVALVSHPKDVNPRAVQGLAMLIQGMLDFVDHKVRHLPVDIAGQLNKSSFDAGLFGLPGQIEGIDGNAMTTQAGAGIKRHEPERLGSGGFDDLPDIHAHAVTH